MLSILNSKYYAANSLRTFIADDLGATAQIKANPGRTAKPPIDWRLFKECHQVECFCLVPHHQSPGPNR